MAIQFDGSGDYYYWAASTTFENLTNLSVSGWVNMDAMSADGMIFATRNVTSTGAESPGIMLFVDITGSQTARTNTIKFGVNSDAGTNEAIANAEGATNAIGAGAWHNAAFSFAGKSNGDDATLFIDGVEDANSPFTLGANCNNSGTPAAQRCSVGADVDGEFADVDGAVAEVGVWNVSLTDAELAALAKCSPLLIRPSNLIFYWPGQIGANDVIGVVGAKTTNGTPAQASSSPNIIYPPKSSRSNLFIPRRKIGEPASSPPSAVYRDYGASTVDSKTYSYTFQAGPGHSGRSLIFCAGLSGADGLTATWNGASLTKLRQLQTGGVQRITMFGIDDTGSDTGVLVLTDSGASGSRSAAIAYSLLGHANLTPDDIYDTGEPTSGDDVFTAYLDIGRNNAVIAFKFGLYTGTTNTTWSGGVSEDQDNFWDTGANDGGGATIDMTSASGSPASGTASPIATLDTEAILNGSNGGIIAATWSPADPA